MAKPSISSCHIVPDIEGHFQTFESSMLKVAPSISYYKAQPAVGAPVIGGGSTWSIAATSYVTAASLGPDSAGRRAAGNGVEPGRAHGWPGRRRAWRGGNRPARLGQRVPWRATRRRTPWVPCRGEGAGPPWSRAAGMQVVQVGSWNRGG
jgi:hypothetical protein